VLGLPAPTEELKTKQKALELLELVGLSDAKGKEFINALRKSPKFPMAINVGLRLPCPCP